TEFAVTHSISNGSRISSSSQQTPIKMTNQTEMENDELVRSIRGLNMESTVTTFLNGHSSDLSRSISQLLDAMRSSDKIVSFINSLLATITDKSFYEKILYA